MFLSKINTGKTGKPLFNAWYKPALSSKRKSLRCQKMAMGEIIQF
jgi:hypothetical protein